MFSFWGDTVLDPFCGTGTTILAAMKGDRNSIGVEIDPEYCQMALKRLQREGSPLFSKVDLEFIKADLDVQPRRKDDSAVLCGVGLPSTITICEKNESSRS
jgi:site-specific DNA-methyltransferase (adenine-specific)